MALNDIIASLKEYILYLQGWETEVSIYEKE
jgi:hypothetical protein